MEECSLRFTILNGPDWIADEAHPSLWHFGAGLHSFRIIPGWPCYLKSPLNSPSWISRWVYSITHDHKYCVLLFRLHRCCLKMKCWLKTFWLINAKPQQQLVLFLILFLHLLSVLLPRQFISYAPISLKDPYSSACREHWELPWFMTESNYFPEGPNNLNVFDRYMQARIPALIFMYLISNNPLERLTNYEKSTQIPNRPPNVFLSLTHNRFPPETLVLKGLKLISLPPPSIAILWKTLLVWYQT